MAAGDQYRRIEPSDMLVFDGENNLVGIRSGKSDSAELRLGASLTADQVQATLALLDDKAGRVVGYENEQPADITAPVTAMGSLAARFASGMWTQPSATATLTQGYTGWDGSGAKTGVTSRTGMPSMLKVAIPDNNSHTIRLQSVGTDMLTPGLGGKLALWVYVESLPGYAVGGTLAGNIDLYIRTVTDTGNFPNGLFVSYNTNQIKEGWNCLKFVMRDPAAYVQGNSQVEYHPLGVSCNTSSLGTGANADIVNDDVARFDIVMRNLSGASLYFDSIWTGWSATPQVVLGCDGGVNALEYALPVFEQYGWVGYGAFPFNTTDSSGSSTTFQVSPDSNSEDTALALYGYGWDIINHSATHPSIGGMSSEAEIAYQLEAAKAYWIERGCIRGQEFYASPQSSSSRLSELVIKTLGYKLQRHARGWNTQVTPWGIPNPHFVGAIDLGTASSGVGVTSVTGGVAGSVTGWQTAAKIKRAIDILVDYEDTLVGFWHGITTSGDSGSGEDATGDNLLITKSAFESVMAYVRQLEQAGALAVPKGLTGFWYGSNA